MLIDSPRTTLRRARADARDGQGYLDKASQYRHRIHKLINHAPLPRTGTSTPPPRVVSEELSLRGWSNTFGRRLQQRVEHECFLCATEYALTNPGQPAGTNATSSSTPIRIVIGDDVVHGELWDNASSRSLITQLPVTLSFSDHNGKEKAGNLGGQLSMEGMPQVMIPSPATSAGTPHGVMSCSTTVTSATSTALHASGDSPTPWRRSPTRRATSKRPSS